MLLNFPAPYRDETLGSLFIRASRRMGYPFGMLKREMGIPINGSVNLAQARWAPAFANALDTPVGELVCSHTLIPYATSVLPQDITAQAIAKACCGEAPTDDAGRNSNSLEGHRVFRFCGACTRLDLESKGESFWRRSHQAQGVTACVNHHVVLKTVSAIKLRREVNVYLPQDLLTAETPKVAATSDVLVAALSERLVHGQRIDVREMRFQALKSGTGVLDKQQFCKCVLQFFSAELLLAADCTSQSLYQFTQRLLRGVQLPSPLPMRYVLLQALCEQDVLTDSKTVQQHAETLPLF